MSTLQMSYYRQNYDINIEVRLRCFLLVMSLCETDELALSCLEKKGNTCSRRSGLSNASQVCARRQTEVPIRFCSVFRRFTLCMYHKTVLQLIRDAFYVIVG